MWLVYSHQASRCGSEAQFKEKEDEASGVVRCNDCLGARVSYCSTRCCSGSSGSGSGRGRSEGGSAGRAGGGSFPLSIIKRALDRLDFSDEHEEGCYPEGSELEPCGDFSPEQEHKSNRAILPVRHRAEDK